MSAPIAVKAFRMLRGMAGILCAHLIRQAGVPYMLVEENTMCSGIAQNTTAKITSQHGLVYDRLIRTLGVERARDNTSPHHQDLLVVGGGGRRTGKQGRAWKELREVTERFPSCC